MDDVYGTVIYWSVCVVSLINIQPKRGKPTAKMETLILTDLQYFLGGRKVPDTIYFSIANLIPWKMHKAPKRKGVNQSTPHFSARLARLAHHFHTPATGFACKSIVQSSPGPTPCGLEIRLGYMMHGGPSMLCGTKTGELSALKDVYISHTCTACLRIV